MRGWGRVARAGDRPRLLADRRSGIAPGAQLLLHEHVDIEQTSVLEGSFEDHEGVCRAGELVWRRAGSRHEAWSEEGALVLVILLQPNRFLDEMGRM
jgi:anti-sigma factor ChrR (cupin superfamily)